jgi:hypothetical protein
MALEYQPPVLVLAIEWHPIAQVYSLHSVLARKGAKRLADLEHLDFYVGRQAPENALSRAVAREIEALRLQREQERGTLPF